MTKKSSKNPRIPKRASGRKSRGEARQSKAPSKQRNILMRNIQKRPPTENISLKACRNKVGRSIILSIIYDERNQKLIFYFSNRPMLNGSFLSLKFLLLHNSFGICYFIRIKTKNSKTDFLGLVLLSKKSDLEYICFQEIVKLCYSIP